MHWCGRRRPASVSRLKPHSDRGRSSALVLGSSDDASCRAEAVVMKLPLVATPSYPSTTQTVPPSCIAPSSASLQLIITLASLFTASSITVAQNFPPRWTDTKSSVVAGPVARSVLLAPLIVVDGRCLLTSAAFSGSDYPEETSPRSQQYTSVNSGHGHQHSQ